MHVAFRELVSLFSLEIALVVQPSLVSRYYVLECLVGITSAPLNTTTVCLTFNGTTRLRSWHNPRDRFLTPYIR
jgi:hypothetical protein